MFLVAGAPGLFALSHVNLNHAVAAHWARSLCPHKRGTRRHRQWVEFYTWKYEKRVRRNVAWQGCVLVHNCWVGAQVLRQLVRLAMALQAIVMGAAVAR